MPLSMQQAAIGIGHYSLYTTYCAKRCRFGKMHFRNGHIRSSSVRKGDCIGGYIATIWDNLKGSTPITRSIDNTRCTCRKSPSCFWNIGDLFKLIVNNY